MKTSQSSKTEDKTKLKEHIFSRKGKKKNFKVADTDKIKLKVWTK